MDYDNVVNEMKYEYNVNMQLQKLYQSYFGALTTYSSAVQYAYDAAHRNRLSSVVYPSGKTVNYSYDSFDNVASINEGTTPLVSYLYDGSGSAMQTTYHQPDVSLSYANSGLDRYGRVINHGWVKNGSALVHIVHGYDYAGNRLYRNDLAQLANSELYSYDNLGQIKMLRRGALNADKTNVAAVNHSEAWNFDKTGNWVEYNKNGMTETRTHNAANELQGIATHDANGNMTLMPGLKGKYDAWNRLVEVRNTDDVVIATYEYNGLNQRIKKTVGGVLTKSFYNENWQEVESVTGSQMTSYVWGVRYIDDLVLREKDEERLYSLADANWNVVALVDASGAVVERIKYDAFGKITWLDADFGAKAASGYGWNRTFTGQVLDSETGLMLYRMRYYHVAIGHFVNRDPIEYEAGDNNLYRYVGNQVINAADPLGLADPCPPAGTPNNPKDWFMDELLKQGARAGMNWLQKQDPSHDKWDKMRPYDPNWTPMGFPSRRSTFTGPLGGEWYLNPNGSMNGRYWSGSLEIRLVPKPGNTRPQLPSSRYPNRP
ncbi:hypothetical protein FACS1894170_10010 [Planctomycetales bacterium]|nr:hypothetical protein FACS1894170_10010 [Planctomycetales bacterium]